MKGREIIRHINGTSLTVFYRNICTLNKRINELSHTHFDKIAFLTLQNSLQRGERSFHDMIDDTNYRWDSKYIKTNLRNLNKNLEWLKSLNNLEQYLGEPDGEGSLDNSRELLVKLEILNHLDRMKGTEDKEELEKYLNSKYPVLASITPYLSGTSQELRRKHLLSNQFLHYIYRLVSRNLENLDTGVLTKYFNLLVALQLEDMNQLLTEMYGAIYKGLAREVCEEEALDSRIKLLSKIIAVADLNLIKDEIQEVLLDSVCTNRVYYDNIEELLHIIYCYRNRVKSSSNWFQWITQGSQVNKGGSVSAESEEFVNEYMEIYVDKLKIYIHMMSTDRVIKVLYFLYKIEHTEEEVFNKIVETLMYRFEEMSREQNEMVLSLLASYMYLFVKRGSDLGKSIYSEGCRMLQSMLRGHVESNLVNVSLRRMFEPLTSLTMLNTKNKNLKELVLKKIDDNMLEQLNRDDFLKFLMLLGNLHINKTNEKISRMINKYVCKNMMEKELLEENDYELLNMLSRFLPKKKYNKYISERVNGYLGAVDAKLEEANGKIGTIGGNQGDREIMSRIMDDEMRRIVYLLGVCMQNGCHKFRGGEVINRLLTKLMTVMLQKEHNRMKNENVDLIRDSDKGALIGSERTAEGSEVLLYGDRNGNVNGYPVFERREVGVILPQVRELGLIGEGFDITKGLRESEGCLVISEDSETEMSNMITILEALNESSLSLENVKYIAEEVYRVIYGILRGRTRWNMKGVQEVLRLIVETRVVPEELVKCIMDYINNYYLISIPEVEENEKEEVEEKEKGVNVKLLSEGEGYRNNFRVNLCLLYAKCVVFLGFRPSSEKIVENIYSYAVSHFNRFEVEEFLGSRVGKKALENMKELMIFEKFGNLELYEKMKKKMSNNLIEYLEGEREGLERKGGKLKLKVSSELGEEYVRNYQIEGLTFDFHSEKKKEAVVILRKNDYYGMEGGSQVYLKHRARVMKEISEMLKIEIKFVPEHTIVEEKQKMN